MIKKLISSLLVLSTLCFPVFADQAERTFTIRDFSGGLNSQASEYTITANQGTAYTNIRPNAVYGGIGKRVVNLEYCDAGAFQITGLHRYYKSDGNKHLIITGSTKIFLGNDAAETCATELGTGFTDGKQWEWVTYKDTAIGMNGTDAAVKWDGYTQATADTDGSRTAGDLVAQLGAPYAELNTGSNLDASSWYQYKIAYTDGTNYSYSTARSNPILTGSTVMDVTLKDIPVGPAGTTARIIYRTVGDASRAAVIADTSFYRVATINDNTTTTYNDAVSDATLLADSAPTWATVSAGTNVTAPLGKFPIIHKEKLFISGNLTDKSDIYWSQNYLPEFFDPLDYEQIRPDDGDEITFLKTFLGILTIGKTNTIQKFYTDGDENDWSISNPFSFVGCIAPRSAASTPTGIFYLGRNGLYRFTGQYSDLVSDAVTQEINDILPSNAENASGFYFKNQYFLAYTSRNAGGTTNNRVLVYNFTRNAYSLDIKSINVFEAFDAGDDFGTLYHGSSTTSGKVYADEGETKYVGVRLKSEFDLGTYDDARSIGTETDPELEISWDLTIDQGVGTIDSGYPGAIIDRPDTNGTWTSPAYNIEASSLSQLQWNQRLNDYGSVSFQVKLASTEGGLAGASWSSAFTNSNGSDLTGLTANSWMQVRINLSTSDIEYTPNIYVEDNYAWKLFYQEDGSSPEPDYLSQWTSGWLNFGTEGYKKLIKRVKVYYTGTSGTINFNLKNNQNDVDRDFEINLATSPSSDTQDAYEGNSNFKQFTYWMPQNSAGDNGPTGEFWKLDITETGATDWKIYAVEFLYTLEENFY